MKRTCRPIREARENRSLGNVCAGLLTKNESFTANGHADLCVLRHRKAVQQRRLHSFCANNADLSTVPRF